MANCYRLANERRAREQDKQCIQTLEKKLVEEQRLRVLSEQTLEKERKLAAKKAADVIQLGTGSTGEKRVVECGDVCRARRRDLDSELKQLRRDVRAREEQIAQREAELHSLRQYR